MLIGWQQVTKEKNIKYAHLEKYTNKLLGWYDDSIHSEIPTSNVEVSDEVWQEAININANCYEDGKFIVKDFRTDEEIVYQELQYKINEAKNYLASTDYKMTVDYFATLDKVTQDGLIAERQKAREFIRVNS